MVFFFISLSLLYRSDVFNVQSIYNILRIFVHIISFTNAGTQALHQSRVIFLILLTAFVYDSEYSFVLGNLDCCLDCFVLVCR